VDHYRDQIFRELLTYMMGDSSVVFPAFELILVAKNLERIGDHATNIAEDVITLCKAKTSATQPSTAVDGHASRRFDVHNNIPPASALTSEYSRQLCDPKYA